MSLVNLRSGDLGQPRFTKSLGVVVFWNYDFQTVFRTTELSTNSLGDLVVLWNYDVHTVFHTAELSTNSLGDFVVFGNYDSQTVSTQRSFQPIP